MTSLNNIQYYLPSTVEETIDVISGESGARIVAGNTLLNELGKRNLLEGVGALVDISQLPLRYVIDDGSVIHLGALVTFTELFKETFVNKPSYAALRQALSSVRPTQIRNAATLGGCIGAGLPFLDVPVALLCLGAILKIKDKDGEHLENYGEYVSQISGGIKSGSLILEVQIPSHGDTVSSLYTRFSTTGLGEAIVNIGLKIRFDKNRKCLDPSIAIGGAGMNLERMYEAEKILADNIIDKSLIDQLVSSVMNSVQANPDLNGSADFKRRVLGVELGRLLETMRKTGGNQL